VGAGFRGNPCVRVRVKGVWNQVVAVTGAKLQAGMASKWEGQTHRA